MSMKTNRYQCSDLPRIVVDYKALIPAVEMLMVVGLHAQFLQHRLISSLPLCMHRSTYIVQDAHYAWGILGKTTQKTFYARESDSHCPITHKLQV